jgi:hypothetical protein
MKTNAHILTRVKEAFFRLDLPLFIEVAVLMMLGNIVGRVSDCGAVETGIIIIALNVTCSRNDIDDIIAHWCLIKQSLTRLFVCLFVC